MKALTFIEFWQKCQKNEVTYGQVIKYEKIVSQPFKPEMITALFEDFVKKNNNWYIWKKEFDFSFAVINYNINKSKQYGVMYARIPKNLNDFISDCQRAGIELQWKEEIYK